jgi:hypothetical protein
MFKPKFCHLSSPTSLPDTKVATNPTLSLQVHKLVCKEAEVIRQAADGLHVFVPTSQATLQQQQQQQQPKQLSQQQPSFSSSMCNFVLDPSSSMLSGPRPSVLAQPQLLAKPADQAQVSI